MTYLIKVYKVIEIQESKQIYNKAFCLKTIYPGLLLGIGNSHDSSSTSTVPEIKMGFSLDYVTGMPVIPGTTVKGVLRSAFINTPEYIEYLLSNNNDFNNNMNEKIKELEYEIFGGPHPCDNNQTTSNTLSNENDLKKNSSKENNKKMGIDVFFDAVIVSGGKNGKIFGLEYITPHVNKTDPRLDGLIEPVPIPLLKIISGVTFEFGFKLKDGIIKADEKLELFKNVILDMGIGAKTNTGFGGMVELNS